MKTTIIKMLICFSIICLPLMVQAQETVKTRIGDLSFTHSFEKGYPTKATQKQLFLDKTWILPDIEKAQ